MSNNVNNVESSIAIVKLINDDPELKKNLLMIKLLVVTVHCEDHNACWRIHMGKLSVNIYRQHCT